MDKPVIFVSYYTPNYRRWVDKLRESLVALELEHDLVAISHQTKSEVGKDRWQANVRYKPQFILGMLEKHPEAKAIVWVDADGLVERRPELLFRLREDLAVCFAPFPRRQPRKYELLSGTVYVANNAKGLEMMRLWVKAMPYIKEERAKLKMSPLLKPEQQVLQALLSIWKCIPEKHYNNADSLTRLLRTSGRCKVSVKNLPDAYCYIRGASGEGSGIITHGQASREWRWPEKARRRKQMMDAAHGIHFVRKRKPPKPKAIKGKNKQPAARRKRRRRMGG